MVALKAKRTGPEDIELIKKALLSYLLKCLEFLNTYWKTGEWKKKSCVLSSI
jgi:hypothetical protein